MQECSTSDDTQKDEAATMGELLSADDCSLNSSTTETIKQCTNNFCRACENLHLCIRAKKTKVMQDLTSGRFTVRASSTTFRPKHTNLGYSLGELEVNTTYLS